MRPARPPRPRAGPTRALALGLGLGALSFAAGAPAAPPVHVSLSTVAAPPGATVVISIDVDQSLAPFNVTSIGYQLTLDPSKIQSASFNTASGLITNWGPPFTNVTPTVAAALGLGFTPITSSATRVENVYLTIAPSVPSGTDIPLAFQSFTLNDGTPAVTLGSGLIQVRATTGVAMAAGASLALGPPEPNPTRGGTRFSVWIPHDGRSAPARATVLDLRGRRVRDLGETPAPGRHELSWNACDDRGARVAPGLYWLALERDGAIRQRRIVVLR